ncbi:MAG: hypothetical protein HRT68_01760 [Flavobacteriaceae bacterium]|nr:hypothetical protein [Flavobacteriaceae bacterium]
MITNEFTYLLKQPEVINEKQTEGLTNIINKFPYFQSAKALYLKGLKNQDSYQYNQELKITAAYTTDRSVLFDFITSEAFNQNFISNEILALEKRLREIYVTDAEVVKGYEEADFSENEPVQDPNLFQPKNPKDLEEDPENILEIGKPLEFNKNEKHSFNEWLQLTIIKPLKKEKEEPGKFDLIDSLLSKNPKIKPPSKTAPLKNLAEEHSHKPEQLMTETLAKVYLEQKNYKKAIQAYKILSLKYPEKSSFFADRIKEIKKLNK